MTANVKCCFDLQKLMKICTFEKEMKICGKMTPLKRK